MEENRKKKLKSNKKKDKEGIIIFKKNLSEIKKIKI